MTFIRVLIPAVLTAVVLSASGCSGRSSEANAQAMSRAQPAWKSAQAQNRQEQAEQPDPQYVHPAFTLTQAELAELVAFLPAGIAENITTHAADFLGRLEGILDLPSDLLVLVDKQHALSADFIPPDLVDLSGYNLLLNRSGLQLREAVMPDLTRMVEAAREAGIKLLFLSAYRSYQYQDTVYSREVRLYGKEVADRESAQPGKSQHQLGTVSDIGMLEDDFDATPAGKWLMRHAWEYGFSLSYPKGGENFTGYKYEPWHYRYITPEAAAFERSYFDGVQQYFLEFLDRSRAALEAARTGGTTR